LEALDDTFHFGDSKTYTNIYYSLGVDLGLSKKVSFVLG